MDTWKRFIQYYLPYKNTFFMDMFCAILVTGVDLSAPLLISDCIQVVFPSHTGQALMQQVYWIIGILLVLYMIRYFSQYYITSYGHIMGAHMESDMRRDLFSHLEKLSFSYYDKNNTGVMMSRIVSDLFDIAELAHHGPEDVMISILKITGSFIILLQIQLLPTIALFSLTLLILIFSIYYNKKMKVVFMDNRKKIGDVNAILQDSLSGIRVVKSFTNEHVEMEKFNEGNELFLESKTSSYMVMGKYMSMTGLMQGLMYISVIASSGYLVSKGSMQPTSMILYILYINMFLEPVNKLVNFTEQFQKGFAGFKRMLEVLDIKPDIQDSPDAVELKDPTGEIRFENVTFGYEEDETVLNNINLQIETGKTIALVGPSGAGKTTFCSLIPRFYEIDKGAILLDGQNIQSFTMESLRKHIGIVQQDVYIFNSTILENIAYGKPDASRQEIIEAAKKANIHDFIMSLDEGYDTMVGERGVRFSGGQKQRISIARVFLKNPPILILDEATSALDNESEKYIQNSLETLSKNRTTIVIAHRLSTVKNADEIVVLTEEGITETGSHQDLLNKDGKYAHMYNMQFLV